MNIIKKNSFEERMKERIKKSIGELMTDEELSKIVHRVMEDVFFKPVVDEMKWGKQTVTQPFVHQLLKELLTPNVTKAVQEYVKTHQEEVLKEINSVVQKGISRAVINTLDSLFSDSMNKFKNDVYGIVKTVKSVL